MPAPYLISLTVTQPTATTPAKLVLIAAQGSSAGPLTIDIPGVTAGIEAMEPVAGLTQYSYTKEGIASGQWQAIIHDASPAGLPDFTADFTVDPKPVPVVGCTDPDADNYDPAANQDNGSCTYSPHLTLAPLPELIPLGVPYLAQVSAARILGTAPRLASALFELAALGTLAGVQVRVDGYLCTSGPVIAPGRFADAPSLLAALRAWPVLATAYTFTQPTATSVLLTATVPGLAGAPTVSTSNANAVAVRSKAGVAELWSQRRARWGCYVEVWAGCGTEFGGVVNKAMATLVEHISLSYRADNVYQVDIAPLLRGRTGHGYPRPDGSCPDRLISYFLRFGEEYVAGLGVQRGPSVYESPVAWGLEAMEVPAPRPDGLRLLSTRPGAWAAAAGALLPVSVLAPADPAQTPTLRSRLATTRATTDQAMAHTMATGQVVQARNRLLAPAGTLAGQLLTAAGEVLVPLTFGARGQALRFVNRQGGDDLIYLPELVDPGGKRTAATFTNTAGSQNLSAELALTTRYSTGLLDYDTWAWLRRELGTSPAAWLENATGPVAVLLADVVAESDVLKGEYSISVDISAPPVRGLSN